MGGDGGGTGDCVSFMELPSGLKHMNNDEYDILSFRLMRNKEKMGEF